ncbi:MAG: CoB--CoM heterodisulfide reductase iron-sulfur subunit A family protein [Promethearchaeota archaeon]
MEQKDNDMEKKDENGAPRVGVFVCNCGSNIGGLIDCKALAEYSSKLPDVVHAEDNLYTCSETGLSRIKNAVKEYDLNRVIVASCTPRTHEPLFMETIAEAGLNPYLFNFVNIRDQCTWVHMKEPKAAFEKARDLITMGVAKSRLLKPLEKNVVQVNPVGMVIGGGVTGMTAALSLSRQGFKTYIIEKEPNLGGLVKNLYKLFPSDTDSNHILEKLKDEVLTNSNLEIITSATVQSINGFVGNYDVLINQEGKEIKLNVGTLIVAIGAKVFTPKGMYMYDGKKRITQLELERQLRKYVPQNHDFVMIQCVGSRNKERPYCSAVCCMTAIKNALIIKEENPDARVTILYRDLYTPGIEKEQYYRKARKKGIIFLRYTPDAPPEVSEDEVKVYSELVRDTISIKYDLLVLSTPMIANEDNTVLNKILKVPLEENGFFLEAHVKLRPVDFATDGIFVAGAAKWPADITESISQGYAAAARASTILSHGVLEVEGVTAEIPEEKRSMCTGCEVCLNTCPFGAITKDENDQVQVIKALCKGCGVCAAACVKEVMTLRHFTTEQIMAEIHAFGGEM